MKRWATIPLLLFLLLAAASAAHAQGVTTATIRGQVVDESGEPLPGANVVAVHQPSGSQYGTATNENGRFTLANVRVGGPYVITASFVGYQAQRETGIRLSLGEVRRFTFTLAAQTQQLDEVEVVADQNAVFSRERTGIETSLSEEEIRNASSVDRSLADFVRLTPQSTTINTGDDGTAFSLAGQNNRYNTIFIDGAVSNDVFGLAETGVDGGQTGSTPISIDAIQQFEIDISPYDVTQSFFGGGAINAVTRSGTNQFKASFAYERRDENFVEDLPDGSFPTFSNNRYVGWASGPIIEDKLFFFVNADILRSETPAPFSGFDGYQGAAINSQAEINDFVSFLDETLGFQPGDFASKASQLDSDKLFAKLDWNISSNHRLSARYSYTQSDNIEVDDSDSRELVFASRNEVFPNTTQIAALEWNGTFGNRVANKLILSYKSVEDDRDTNLNQPFPTISITDGPGAIEIGGEPFSTLNFLGQDVVTLTNNASVFLGDHTITIGTHNEWYDLANKFVPFNYGWYFFESVDQFRQTACAAAANPESIGGCAPFDADPNAGGYQRPAPSVDFFQRAFSLVDDDPSTPAFEEQVGDASDFVGQFNALLSGFYVQDEWQATDRLRLTYGLRVDIPFILDEPPYANPANPLVPDNPQLNPFNTTLPAIQQYYSLQGAAPGQSPDPTLHWAPRFGFNWDVFGDQRTQLRGGVGVFTSRQPFVWYGGMFLNNGVLSGQVNAFGAVPLVTDPTGGNGLTVADPCCGGRTPSELIPSGRLEIFEEAYKLPRFLRYSLGLDQQLPGGWVGTLEGQYTNTLSNILVTNINLLPANETLDGPDNRPIWVASLYDNAAVGPFSDGIFIDGRYTDIHRVGNTDRGYSYNVTARLRNTFEDVLVAGNAVYLDASYTYGDSYVINEGTSSQINSLWEGMEHVNGANNLGLSRSDFSLGHRVLARMNYRQAFGQHFAANVGLTYVGQSGRPLSYTIDGSDDLVGEEGDPVALFYVPRTASALTFEETTIDGVTISPAQQAAALNQFISENDYLNRRRGQYAERNGDRTPFEGVVDLNLRFEIAGELVGRTQSIEITADIFNFSSMLGDVFGTDWGERFLTPGQFTPVQFQDFVDLDNGNFTPIYTAEIVNVADVDGDGDQEYAGAISQDEVFDRLRTGSTYSSQWQMKLGVRYTF